MEGQGQPHPLERCSVCGKEFAQCLCPLTKTLAINGFTISVESDSKGGAQLVPAESEADVGDIVGERYHLLSVLGAGGMGKVFKARHVTLPKFFAVKVLKCELSKNPDFRARFDQEAKTASLLNHPHLVSIYDYGATAQDEAYLVMDYLDGESLADSLAVLKRIDQRSAVKIFIQICDGLIHAHSLGVIHRDLKPSNIMLVRTRECSDFVKVVDFGIAKMLGVDGIANITQSLTRTGQFFGSPLYMSPEQASGGKADQRTDIYALGVVMYECLTSAPPFKGDNFFSTLTQHLESPAKPFNAELGINKKLETIVMKALEKDPDRRFQSMDELKAALTGVFNEQANSLSKSVKPKLLLPAALVILICGGTVAGALLLSKKIPSRGSLGTIVAPESVPAPEAASGLPSIPDEIRLPQADSNRSAEELLSIGKSLLTKDEHDKTDSLLPARYFTCAAEKDPKLRSAFESLCAFYWIRQNGPELNGRINNLEKCLAVYSVLIKQYPDDFRLYSSRASVYTALSQHVEALADTNKGLKISPNDTDLHLAHAYANYNLNHPEESLAEYAKYRRPADTDSGYIMGCCYQQLNKHKEAIALATEVMKIAGPTSGLLIVRGDSEKALSRFKEALNDYQTMVKLFPDTLKARANSIADCKAAIARRGS